MGGGGAVAWQPDLNVSHEMAARFGGTQVIGSKPRRQITSVDTSERPERSPAAACWGSTPPGALFPSTQAVVPCPNPSGSSSSSASSALQLGLPSVLFRLWLYWQRSGSVVVLVLMDECWVEGQPCPPTELSSAQASEVRRFRQEDHVAPLLRQMIYLISVLSPGRPQALKSGLTGNGAV